MPDKDLAIDQLARVYKVDATELRTSLYNEDGSPKDDAQDVLDQHQTALNDAQKTARTNQFKRGIAEGSKPLNAIRDRLPEEQRELKGDELITAFESHLSADFEKKLKPGDNDKDVTPAQVINSDTYKTKVLELEGKVSTAQNALKTEKEKWEGDLNAEKEARVKDKQSLTLGKLGRSMFNDFKPVIPGEGKASVWEDKFAREVKGIPYKMDGENMIPIDSEGNQLEDPKTKDLLTMKDVIGNMLTRDFVSKKSEDRDFDDNPEDDDSGSDFILKRPKTKEEYMKTVEELKKHHGDNADAFATDRRKLMEMAKDMKD